MTIRYNVCTWWRLYQTHVIHTNLETYVFIRPWYKGYFVFYNTISGHAFNQSDRCVCAGYDNGDIKMFDLRNMALQWETNIKNGVSKKFNLQFYQCYIFSNQS
jgi:hypothetical protein